MSRIEDAAIQDEVANSLLGPERSNRRRRKRPPANTRFRQDLLNEEIGRAGENVFRDGDEGTDGCAQSAPDEERPEAQTVQGWRQAQPGAEEQPEAAEPTRSSSAGIAALDATIEQHGPKRPAVRGVWATDFCSPFDDIYKSGVDVRCSAGRWQKVRFVGCDCYRTRRNCALGHSRKRPQRLSLTIYSKGSGSDPRSVPVNEQMLAKYGIPRGALFLRHLHATRRKS